jgi:predicted sulfurtransferase/predicted O-methyltransferase YrrM
LFLNRCCYCLFFKNKIEWIFKTKEKVHDMIAYLNQCVVRNVPLKIIRINIIIAMLIGGFVQSTKLFTQQPTRRTSSISFISFTKINNPTSIKQQQRLPFLFYARNNQIYQSIQQQTKQNFLSLSLSSSSIEKITMDDFVSNSTTTTTGSNTLFPPSNSELAQRRIYEYQLKKIEKIELSKRKAQRNLHTKRIVQGEISRNSNNNLIQIKVIVDDILRNELKLSGREKRGRIFIESESNITSSYNLFKREIHAFFRALQKDTYLLYASLPLPETENGKNTTTATILSDTVQNNKSDRWEIRNDNDVTVTFQRAIEHFENIQQHHQQQQQLQQQPSQENIVNENSNTDSSQEELTQVPALTRPTFVLHVIKNPNSTSYNNTIPLYLQNMPNPNDSTTITMLSFYSFGNIQDPDNFAKQLKILFKPFNAQGRIYVATEGINAQMSVPTNVLQQFITVCEYHLPDPTISYYLRTYGNSVNIDPIPLTIDEYNVAGIPSAATTITKDGTPIEQQQQQQQPCPPFTALHIRVRQQIVSDGLDKPYDWIHAGTFTHNLIIALFDSGHLTCLVCISYYTLNQKIPIFSLGYDMPPLEWHTKLLEAKILREEEEQKKQSNVNTEENSDKQVPIILDCRNTYETDVGIFDGAIPLQTTTFKDTWDAIENQLIDKPKDTPIYMYCTGGIRCVKVGAYVTQQLGYTNVNRLAGGIIAYDRALTTNFTTTVNVQSEEKLDQDSKDVSNDEQVGQTTVSTRPTQEPAIDTSITKSTTSLFKGTNFVFDGRLGRTITDDAIGTCITCGCKTTFVSNCRNNNCHKRMVQCTNCHTTYYGTCSTACRNRYNLLQQKQQHQQQQQQPANENIIVQSSTTSDTDDAESIETMSVQQPYTSIDSYSIGHSSPLPAVYPEMEFNTKALIPSGSHMVSGQAQGRLLKQLASMTREGRVLELGTFTGYATSCFLEGSIEAGKVIGTKVCGSRSNGPFVLSMERDMKAFDVAVSQLQIISEHGFHGDTAMEAMCSLRSNTDPAKVSSKSSGFVDNQSITVTTPDNIASCEIMKVSDALATIEEMALLCSTQQPHREETKMNDEYIAPFDLVFVDADKTRLLEYVEVCLNTDYILKKGGLIVVDNVLWKGLVLNASSGGTKINNNGDNNDDDNDCANSQSDSDNENVEGFTIPIELRKNRRARKLANKLHRFNTAIVKDQRVEVLILPIRDGLSIIRKK